MTMMATRIVGIAIFPTKIIVTMLIIEKRNLTMMKMMDVTMQIRLFSKKETCPT